MRRSVTVALLCLLGLLLRPSESWLPHSTASTRSITTRTLLLGKRKSNTQKNSRGGLANLEVLKIKQSTYSRLDKAVQAFEAMVSQTKRLRTRAKRTLTTSRHPFLGSEPIGAPNQSIEDTAINANVRAKRKELPVYEHRGELLEAINNNPVSIVVGPTGSGKSTQVPQFLLEHYMAQSGEMRQGRVICTQPRRLAASSLATRVAFERGEKPGQSVGYMMSRDQKVSADSKLVFMTQGVLLRLLENNPTLEGINYLILDEVHERSLETDFLLPILRDLVKKRDDFHLVIMSATVRATDFTSYFGDSPVISIQGRSFPVDEFFFEDVQQITNTKKALQKIPPLSQRKHMSPESMARLEANPKFLEDNLPYSIMTKLINHIHTTCGDGAILVFLPGLPEIEVMREMLQRSNASSQFKIHCLHSTVPIEEQRLAFLPPAGGQRKVILSTNVAESSITINDAVYVIDSGKHKAAGIDDRSKAASLNLQWVSQASATQRAGRAGRVQPGKCWHMIPRSVWQALPAFDTPEISRTPLEEVCLRVRALRLAPNKVNGIAAFLSTLMTPPEHDVVAHAVSYLKDMGALHQDEGLTVLGRYMSVLPLHPNLARAVLYGLLFKCLDPIVTLVAFIRDRSPFVVRA